MPLRNGGEDNGADDRQGRETSRTKRRLHNHAERNRVILGDLGLEKKKTRSTKRNDQGPATT